MMRSRPSQNNTNVKKLVLQKFYCWVSV